MGVVEGKMTENGHCIIMMTVFPHVCVLEYTKPDDEGHQSRGGATPSIGVNLWPGPVALSPPPSLPY